VANVMLGWEDEKLSLRLSANYKSEYLDEVTGFSSNQGDTTADSQTFVDFTASYFVSRNLQVKFEAQNITDEVYYTYVNNPRYNAQYEEYGPTYKLGVTFTQF
jgi:outer membrane receptor protein involved in Fe transport